MSQLGVVAYHREGVGFAFRNCISAEVIPQTVISIKGITIILYGFRRLIHYILDGLLSAFPDYFPTQIAARLPVYHGDYVDPVFLLPIKVNNSSISASCTSSGKGAAGNLAARALTHKEMVR